MPMHELGGIPIESSGDLQSIPHFHEAEFGRLLLSRQNEDLAIDYEPVEFRIDGPHSPSHVPDYRLRNLESGKVSFLELTTSPYHPEQDPKLKQKLIIEEVSRQIGERILYIVLYAHNLRKIQELNPELSLNFFHKRHRGYYAK